MSNQPPKGVRELPSVESIMGNRPKGQLCARCGVINSDDAVRCAWCNTVLATAKPDPMPETRRIGPEPKKP